MGDCNKIAISGKISSGKTTVANMLQNEYGYTRVFFADALKNLCKDIASFNSLTETEPKREALEKIWNDVQDITVTDNEYYTAMQLVLGVIERYKDVKYEDVVADNKTTRVRAMFQEVGTEVMRLQVNDNIWCNAALKKINKLSHDDEIARFVVDDMRYQNEYELLKQHGFVVIRLEVSKEVQLKRVNELYGQLDESRLNHISETALDHMPFDYVIDADQCLERMLNDIRALLKY